jgi:hypothetical protein
MLAAFLPLVLACDVFLLGTATVDTSLYVQISLLYLYLSYRTDILYSPFSGLSTVLSGLFDALLKKIFIKRWIYILICVILCMLQITGCGSAW